MGWYRLDYFDPGNGPRAAIERFRFKSDERAVHHPQPVRCLDALL